MSQNIQREICGKIVEESPNQHLVVDRDYQVLYANASARGLYPGLEDPGSSRFCYALTHGRGEPCFIHGEQCPLREAGGTIVALVEVPHDLSNPEVLRSLEESEARFRTMMESTPDAIVIAYEDGIIVDCNLAASSMFGYSPGELVSQDVSLLMPPENRASHHSFIEQAVRTGNFRLVGKTLELTGWHKENGPFPIELSLSTWLKGTSRYFSVLIRDISKRKKLEASLVDEKKRLEQSRNELLESNTALHELMDIIERAKLEWEHTMDGLGEMVLLVDSESRVRRCNRAFTDFAGKPFQELLGHHWFDLFRHQGLEDPPCTDGEERFHAASLRWLRFKLYPIRNQDVPVADFADGMVITVHDITDIKQAGMALLQKNKEIEEKRQELQQAYNQLKQAQSQLLQREKMASIGQLAAGVAHEINNPIGFVGSNLGTLHKYVGRFAEFIRAQDGYITGNHEPGVAENLDVLRERLKVDFILRDTTDLVQESLEGIERVKIIVQCLKTFSRVDQAERQRADINACLESTINVVWNDLKYRAVLYKDLGVLPLVECFPHQLNQVFMNLLLNAVQSLNRKGIISVRTWVEGDSVFISVGDTGRGIPEEIRDRIFDPFFTTKKVGKGTGLGLSIVYDIITKKHGGSIRVESRVGEGSTFTVQIPAHLNNGA